MGALGILSIFAIYILIERFSQAHSPNQKENLYFWTLKGFTKNPHGNYKN